jgi:NAD(P)-dependent dehydrogenase (short-subunit alcohol dehydrogenase family)
MRTSHLALFVGAGVLGLMLGSTLSSRRTELRGKLILITGGSRGLGLELARQLSAAGARVHVCARDEAELRRAAHDIMLRGRSIATHVCDVTEPGRIRELIDRIHRDAGPIDILINNAGVITMAPVHEMTEADFREALDLYFWAAYHATSAVLPVMRGRGSGQIVNISSIGGKVPVPHLTPYCVGKFALTGYSACMRAELAKEGVGVTTICPFVMRTGSQLNAQLKGRHRAEFAWFMLAGSSAPFSIPVERAAARIVRAIERNEGEVMVGVEAKLGTRLYGLAPNLTGCLLRAVNFLLPRSGGIGREYRRGLESRGWFSTLAPTRPIYRAAVRNNQVVGERERVVREIIGDARRALTDGEVAAER